MPPLVSPYPGGKGGARYLRQGRSRICDRPYGYDVVVEPFAGSGAVIWQHPHGVSAAIAADVDPGLCAVWRCWGDRGGSRGKVLKLLEWHKGRILNNPDEHFNTLIEDSNDDYFCLRGGNAAAASYLTLKRLTFGGVLRCNKAGRLNVALSADKLDKFINAGKRRKQRCKLTIPLLDLDNFLDDYWGWEYQWPSNGIQGLTFAEGWQGAVTALENSPYRDALVVLDPPYYSPQAWVEVRKDGRQVASKMTPAYRKHNPQSADELALCLNSLDAVLATGKSRRVVLFNYWSTQLDEQIRAVLTRHGCLDCAVSRVGYLGGMNNAQKFHKRDVEAVWEIGGQQLFRDFDAIEQLDLLTIA